MKFEDEIDVVPPEGNVFVNHEINGRSGHLGHALVEYEEGKILAFYPNWSLDEKGHSAIRWMEYKRSEDYGETWSQPYIFQLSLNLVIGKGTSHEKLLIQASHAYKDNQTNVLHWQIIKRKV